MFFVGDYPVRHRIRRRTTEDDEKDRSIEKTVRAVKYKGHLPEAYKGAKDLSSAPFFFGIGVNSIYRKAVLLSM